METFFIYQRVDSDDVLTKGISGVKCAGFFGNDWSVGKGDFVWKK